MRLAIMQPYFLPYIGYFQLVNAVDRFVIYDTIEYTKKGWINRNRMLRDGQPVTFTIPIEKGSDTLDIRERRVAESFLPSKLLAQVEGAYAKAPQKAAVLPALKNILEYPSASLFDFIAHGLQRTCDYLGIETPLIAASEVEDRDAARLRGQDRVLDLCKRVGADNYVNPIGGRDLYDGAAFAAQGIKLEFLQTKDLTYPQFGDAFEPNLSILDVMMFNPVGEIRSVLENGFVRVEPRE